MKAEDAQPGDVVLAPDGQVYQAPYGGLAGWSRMQMIGFYGDPARTAPDGELTLIGRDGQPYVSDELAAEIREALAAAERGEAEDLGSFARKDGEPG